MPKDKKGQPLTWKDSITKNLSIAGVIIQLLLLIPHIPWRLVKTDPNYGSRFAVSRQFSPFWATNGLRQGVSWMKLQKDTCAQVKSYNSPNPIGLLVSVAATASKTSGSVGGCMAWQSCKKNAATRCYEYTRFAIFGVMVMTLQLASVIASICVVVYMGMEVPVKKKKKKEEEQRQEAMQKTQIAAITAFVSSFVAVLMYVGVTDIGFKNIKSTGYYPWPALFIGGYMALFGVFLQFIAMLTGIWRCMPQREEEQEDEQPEYMGVPPMGAMPPYDPMMGPPPPMMGPPMGGPPMGPPMGMGMGGGAPQQW